MPISTVLIASLLALGACMCAGAADAAPTLVYKCFDRDVNVLYTDQPCPGEQIEIRAGEPDAAAVAALQKERDALAKSIEQRIADDGAALLDHLGIDKAVVGGCSMGGYAAFAFVRRHPQRLAGLVLQDTRAGADTAEAKANRATLAAKVLAEGASAAVEAFLPKLVGETTHRERPAVVAALRERILATSPQAIANALHGLAARADSRETLPTIAVPTLVLVGTEDVLTPPPEAVTMAAAIPRARLDVIPGAGHLANLESPDAVNAVLRAFLARS